MARVLNSFKHSRFFALAMLVAVSTLCSGCVGDTDTRTVNFSDTVQVARPDTGPPEQQPLRVAVAAMVSPKETFVYYREILDYIGRKLGKEVQMIQRKTYAEIDELLGNGQIDVAFLCSGPYAAGKDKYGFQLLATPEVHGSHFYQAYLIVNGKSRFQRLEDLRGKTFAFTDPDSNTGTMVPTYWLATIQERPGTFFGNTIYTYSHDNSILAVARGMVDGASVDGLVWEYYKQANPSLTSKTRIIRKSEQYGIPPLVASRSLSDDLRGEIRSVLFSMHEDAAGRKILDQLMIDRFVEPQDEWYDSIRRMVTESKVLLEKGHGS